LPGLSLFANIGRWYGAEAPGSSRFVKIFADFVLDCKGSCFFIKELRMDI
jgi:hypothetical protein